MSIRINDALIEQTAILAKLNLSRRDKEQARQDMQQMLDYIECLNELDTEKTEPLKHMRADGNVFREDVVTNVDQRADILANAPKQKDGQFQVPKTVE